MSLFKLAIRSLAFYRRTSLGVVLAAAVSTAVLAGALVIGDCVKYSLRRMVDVRLGSTQMALVAQNRFFREQLGAEVGAELGVDVAALMQLRALAAAGDGSKRANDVQVLGVSEDFYSFGGVKSPFAESQGVVLNTPLARKLGVSVGDDVVLRIAKPGLMPRDVPLTPDSDLSVASRVSVVAIAGEDDFGYFNLRANQIAPLNAFVPLKWLQERASRPNMANVLLAADGPGLDQSKAEAAIAGRFKPGDAAVELKKWGDEGAVELRSSRVFIEQAVADAALKADGAFGVLTYFVNEIRNGEKATPYSVATALPGGVGVVPADMTDEQIVLNQWTAEDIDAKVGDMVEIAYFVIGPMRKLVEQRSRFEVRAIVPVEAADRGLMPDYPGLADVNNCRDWEPGIPIDLDKIRDKDEDYWDDYKGTPKAFVTLAAGQKMWGNRYGKLTMVRYEPGTQSQESVETVIREGVDPAAVGLFFQPVRQRGLKASSEGTDFGQLFLGLSMFLIAAALVLMGLIFIFGAESRTEQVGMLLAVGLRARRVRWVLLIEGALLALAGVVLGTLGAIGYTRVMVFALGGVWSSAVAGSTIHFHASGSTLAIGAVSTFLVSMFAIWLTIRKQAARPARELLSGQLKWQFLQTKVIRRGLGGYVVGILGALGAAALLLTMGSREGTAAAGVFFGAGALLLIAGFGIAYGLLGSSKHDREHVVTSIFALGLRNAKRRRGRSLAVVILLAAGVFLVVAVGANRQDPMAGTGERNSGTGGFDFYGESAIGILHNLNSAAGREAAGLSDGVTAGVEFIQMRVHEGDDASCFNLNRAQRPRLLGVPSARLSELGAFTFAGAAEQRDGLSPWQLLEDDPGDDVVAGIGDYATTTWALGKKIGDDIDYVDEMGRPFKVRLVATLKNSILQGSLIVDESDLAERFPSDEGYRAFLVDANDAAGAKIADSLQDYGLTLTPTVERLAAFHSVENTYLTIFQMLGGLGLVLGSIGLGLVVLRNVLDRRGELAMLRAVGFEKAAVRRMLFHEHWGLMLAGLAIGVIAAVVAVMPALRAPGADVPYDSLLLTVAAIAVSGMIWIAAATGVAIAGRMLDALRSE